MKRFFIVILFLCFGAAHAADRSIRLGPFTPDMTFDEIEKEAGIKGTRWCKTWEPNPTIHYCKLTIETNKYHLVVQKGGANETLEMDRRIPVPEGMSFDDIMKQVLAKFSRFGKPMYFHNGYNWGCPKGECGKGIMIRAFVHEGMAGILGGSRHLSIGWRDWEASKANQARFQKESSEWENRDKVPTSPPPHLKL